MPPPIMRMSTLLHEVAEEVELGRHLGAADNRGDRTLRIAERETQRLELLLHRAPRAGRQLVGEPLGRGVRAVGGRERVVDIEVAELGELFHQAPDRSSPRLCGSECSLRSSTSPFFILAIASAAGLPNADRRRRQQGA